jgi:OOP family OmpA-OmpF porin
MNKTFLNLVVIAGLGLSAPAFAHEAGQANASVVGDGTGHCISSGSGENVRTSAWTAEEAAVACGATVAAAAEPAPEPMPTPVSETITLSAGALFDFDKSTIKPDAAAQLDEFAARIGRLSSVDSVSVVGHTDSVGTDAYNEKLSMRRASSVSDYLVGRGVNAAVINTSGMGESQPVADNSTADGREQNRRVEITFKGSETLK